MCLILNYITDRISTRLHAGPECRIFYIITSENIDDVIYPFFAFCTMKMASNTFIYILNRKLHGGLKI